MKKDLQIKTSGELHRVSSVKVNGTELPASNYTKTSGSTIITLKKEYLNTLALGTYTLELGYTDGTKIETKFEVDKIYTSDTENEENENTTGNTGDKAEGTTEDITDKKDENIGEVDNTENNTEKNTDINKDDNTDNNSAINSTTNNNTNSSNNPETGDNIVLYVLLLIASVIGIITTMVKKYIKE